MAAYQVRASIPAHVLCVPVTLLPFCPSTSLMSCHDQKNEQLPLRLLTSGATLVSFHFPRNTKIVAHAVRIGAQRMKKQRLLSPISPPGARDQNLTKRPCSGSQWTGLGLVIVSRQQILQR